MNYEDRIVCFLDILGFSTHVKASVNKDGTDNLQKIKTLNNALQYLGLIIDDNRLEKKSKRRVTQFSDSIVISFPETNESGVFWAIADILGMQAGLVQYGILCRGGIARGKLIHTGNLIFGPAMVAAYTLESNAAMYPRVILDEEIINTGMLAHADHHSSANESESIRTMLQKDSDGMYYIDYITSAKGELNDPDLEYPNYLQNLRSIISQGLKSNDQSVLIKYKWMKERFAPHLENVKASYARLPDQAEIFKAYNSIKEL